jgi:hypothetical protein
VKVGFFEDEDEQDLFAATLRACRKVILRYNAGRLWRKTSRQTKTA